MLLFVRSWVPAKVELYDTIDITWYRYTADHEVVSIYSKLWCYRY